MSKVTLVLGMEFCLFAAFCTVASGQSGARGQSGEETPHLAGPIRIVKLLWNGSPENAAQTLSGTITKAVSRGQIGQLREPLRAIESETATFVRAGDLSDPRYVPALTASLLLAQDPSALATQVRKVLNGATLTNSGPLLLSVWFASDRAAAFAFFSQSIQKELDPAKAAALIDAAVAVDRIASARLLLANWDTLAPATKLAAIEPLTASAETMQLLIAAVRSGVCNKDLVNTNQLRKWTNSPNTELRKSIESVWGKIRETDDRQRQAMVAKTLKLLHSGVSGSASRGEVVFTRVCSQCHVLHGKGFEVGPSILGNGRGSMDQLVSNIFDPSLVIGEAFQAKTVLTVDGEVVSGLVAAEDERYLKLKVQGGKTVEFDKEEDIELLKTSSKSLMPEGVEEQLTEQELIDLIAYLCLLKPLGAADNELIPGTPDGFVEP